MTVTASTQPPADETTATSSDLITRAASVVPLLCQNAKATEENRRVVEENIEAIRAFRCRQKMMWKGIQIPQVTTMQTNCAKKPIPSACATWSDAAAYDDLRSTWGRTVLQAQEPTDVAYVRRVRTVPLTLAALVDFAAQRDIQITPEWQEGIKQEIRSAAYRVRELTGASRHGIGLAVSGLLRCIGREAGTIIPVSVRVTDDVCASLPCALGPDGPSAP
jgi:hypothetical protein